MIRYAIIFIGVIAMGCMTLSVVATLMGAWWHIQGIPSKAAFEAALACFTAGGLSSILGAAFASAVREE